MMPYAVRLTVRECLKSRGVTAYQVAAHTKGCLSRNAVYALARNQADRLDLRTLEKFALALEQLTGQPVALDELLVLDRGVERVPKPQPPPPAATVPDDVPFFTVPGGARVVGDGATAAELLQAIRWHKTLRATEIKPGVYRLSQKDLASYQQLRRRGKHQPKGPPLRPA